MALVRCVECGGTVSEKAAACPHCGLPATAYQRPVQPAQPQGVHPQAHHQQQPQTYAQPTSKEPTRSLGFAVIVFLVPSALFVVHAIAFGLPGILPLAMLATAGLIVGVLALFSENMRTKTTSQLLRSLYKSKVLLGVTTAAVMGAEVSALLWGASAARTRSRIDELLASADPCVIEKADLGGATTEQRTAADKMRSACETKRTQERDAARVEQCKQIAGRAAANKLTAEDEVFLDAWKDLAKRIATKKVSAADLRDQNKKRMPCSDNDSVETWWSAYVKAAASSDGWGQVDLAKVSSQLIESIGKDGLGIETKTAIAKRLAISVAEALRTPKGTTDLEAGKTGCMAADTLALPEVRACARLLSSYEAFRKREDAAAKAKRNADEAEEAKDTERNISRCRTSCFNKTVRNLEANGEDPNDPGIGGLAGISVVCERDCRKKYDD